MTGRLGTSRPDERYRMLILNKVEDDDYFFNTRDARQNPNEFCLQSDRITSGILKREREEGNQNEIHLAYTTNNSVIGVDAIIENFEEDEIGKSNKQSKSDQGVQERMNESAKGDESRKTSKLWKEIQSNNALSVDGRS